MTLLSVNLNKIALLRNSRGRDYPHLLDFAQRYIALGVHGLTIHPRPDERHIRYQDARDLSAMLSDSGAGGAQIELNIEGYPSDDFMALVEETRPTQCTLVPDAPGQLTSDHGWDFHGDTTLLNNALQHLRSLGIRTAVFLDPDPDQARLAADSGAARIELYTEAYAQAYGSPDEHTVLKRYRDTAVLAQSLGLAVNAGHDLNLDNLGQFLATVPGVQEVSIGHALTVECLLLGMDTVIARYLALCNESR